MKALIFRKSNFNLKDLPIQKLNSCRNPPQTGMFQTYSYFEELKILLPASRKNLCPHDGRLHFPLMTAETVAATLGRIHSLSCSKSPDFPTLSRTQDSSPWVTKHVNYDKIASHTTPSNSCTLGPSFHHTKTKSTNHVLPYVSRHLLLHNTLRAKSGKPKKNAGNNRLGTAPSCEKDRQKN